MLCLSDDRSRSEAPERSGIVVEAAGESDVEGEPSSCSTTTVGVATSKLTARPCCDAVDVQWGGCETVRGASGAFGRPPSKRAVCEIACELGPVQAAKASAGETSPVLVPVAVSLSGTMGGCGIVVN